MWQLYVLFAMLAVIVPTTLASFFLVWRGLRGGAELHSGSARTGA
jgi:hypothetical protein